MDVAATMYRQFHKPTGLLGRVAGWVMAHRPSNIARSRWTVDLLQIQENDHVLEIGFGPGVSIEHAARRAPGGRVVGIDHSALMVEQARRRNRSAVEAGLVDLKQGSLDLVPQLGRTFDKAFVINVFQFLPDYAEALRAIRPVVKPGGLLAMTFQPRHRGATAESAQTFARALSNAMVDAGFRDVSVQELNLKPIPAVCVLGRA